MAQGTDTFITVAAVLLIIIIVICLIYSESMGTRLTFDNFMLAIHDSWVGERIVPLG